MEECRITNDSLVCLLIKNPESGIRGATFEVKEDHKELIDKAASVQERSISPTKSESKIKAMHQSILPKRGQFEAYELKIKDFAISNPTSEEESLGGLSRDFDYCPLVRQFALDQVGEEKEEELKEGLRETHPFEEDYYSSSDEGADGEVLSFSKRLMII